MKKRWFDWWCRHHIHSWRWLDKDSKGRNVWACRHCHIMGTR